MWRGRGLPNNLLKFLASSEKKLSENHGRQSVTVSAARESEPTGSEKVRPITFKRRNFATLALTAQPQTASQIQHSTAEAIRSGQA